LVLGQGAEQEINGQMGTAPFLTGSYVQDALGERHFSIGRDDINMIGPHGQALGRFQHRHMRRTSQELWQSTLVPRVKVLDNDESHARIGWQVRQQLAQRLQPTCRGADANNGKRTVPVPFVHSPLG
jgi:hypothetical protein